MSKKGGYGSQNTTSQSTLAGPSVESSNTMATTANVSTTLSNIGRVAGDQVGGGHFRSYIEDHLHRMHHEIEATTRKLELERRRLHTLDEALKRARVEEDDKRTKYKIGAAAAANNALESARKLTWLECKLEKAIAKLNAGNCENDQMKEQIDQLRRERAVLDTVYRRVAREIQNAAGDITKMTGEMDETGTAREDANQKVRALMKQVDRERTEFKETCQAMREDMFQQDKIKKEMEIRTQSNLRRGGGRSNQRAYMVADEEDDFSEQVMYRRILKLAFLNCIQRRHIKQHQKNIEVFDQAFATIKSSTGIMDIDEIVKIFVNIEERNFSLLTYVNQLNRDIESIEMRNKDLHQQLKDYQEQEEQSAIRKRATLSDLESQIRKTRAASNEKNAEVQAGMEILEGCRDPIWKTVSKLAEALPQLAQGYDGEPLSLKGIEVPSENEENFSTYLMYVEEFILQFQVFLPADSPLRSIKPPPPKRGDKALIPRPGELPSAHLAAESDDDEDPGEPTSVLPLTRSELKQTVERSIQKRRKNRHQGAKPQADGGRIEAASQEADAPGGSKQPPPAGTKGPGDGGAHAQGGAQAPNLAKSASMTDRPIH